MPVRLSRALGLKAEQLAGHGVFNGFVDIDSKFHVDPHLLDDSAVAEFDRSHERFLSHFAEVVRLLDTSTSEADVFFRQAVRHLTFREFPHVALGYSQGGTSGSGVGPGLAKRLARTARQIVAAGIKDPELFEIVGLLEEGFGADRISDMAISILLADFLNYSQRVAEALGLPTRRITARSVVYQLPVGSAGPLIFVPKDILKPLPTAYDWSDIDLVCGYNEALRARVNKAIGGTWRYATQRIPKRVLLDTLLRYPEALRNLLDAYKQKSRRKYDYERDPDGEIVWHDIAQDFANRYPLEIDIGATASAAAEAVWTICRHFKKLIEDNGLYRMLYNDAGGLRHERFAQLLFFAVADAYCAANDLDLSREPNAGRGPVDFKISSGYNARVLVEVKYTSNSRLVHGYEKQLPVYAAADSTSTAFYVILRTTSATTALQSIRRLRDNAVAGGQPVPEILIVDARLKRPASRA